MEMLLSDARGVYIPRDFALVYGDEFGYEGVSSGYTYNQAIAVIKQGPDTEWYWDAWQAIIESAKSLDGMILYQDGDLFSGTAEEIEEAFPY